MATRGRVKTVLVPGEDTQPVTESGQSEETETAVPEPASEQKQTEDLTFSGKIKKAVLTEKGWVCPAPEVQQIPVARGK